MVHQKPDRAQLHAKHRAMQVTVAMQSLQHEAIASQYAQHLGILRRVLAMHVDKRSQRLLRRLGTTGEKRDTGMICHRSGQQRPGSKLNPQAASASLPLRRRSEEHTTELHSLMRI